MRIKKLERKVETFFGKSPEEIESFMKELETLKAELESTKKLLGEKDELLTILTKERAEKEAALVKSLSDEKAVARDGVEQKVTLADWVEESVAFDEGKEFIAAKEEQTQWPTYSPHSHPSSFRRPKLESQVPKRQLCRHPGNRQEYGAPS